MRVFVVQCCFGSLSSLATSLPLYKPLLTAFDPSSGLLKMADVPLPTLIELLLDYLYDALPSTVYALVDTLVHHVWGFTCAVVTAAIAVFSSTPVYWDAEKILPPIITLLAAYLALVSFYRTTGWMIRTAFAFVKWGFILTTLGAAAGYILANGAHGAAGDGIAVFGGGVLPMIGGFLLGLLNGDNKKTSSSRSRASSGRRPKSQTKSQSRPKAWESWDQHRDWQYSANANEGRDAAAEVQKVVREVLGTAGKAVTESGWWEAAKGVVNDFKTQAEEANKGSSRQKAKADKASRSR